MVRHILFTSQKGGVGKSTLARSAAVALACAGRKVLLADFDVEQRTCLRWHAQREARGLKPKIAVAKFSKEAKLGRVSHDYDDVVMDTRGHHDALSLDLATVSDVIFLPSSFSSGRYFSDAHGGRIASPGRNSIFAYRRRVLSNRRICTASAPCAFHLRNERNRCARCRVAPPRWLCFTVCDRSDRPRGVESGFAVDRNGS